MPIPRESSKYTTAVLCGPIAKILGVDGAAFSPTLICFHQIRQGSIGWSMRSTTHDSAIH
jgi:hypothetical protein